MNNQLSRLAVRVGFLLLAGLCVPMILAHGQAPASAPNIVEFEIPGSGTGSTQGTYVSGINVVGTTAGAYVDPNGVYHGFSRAANGTVTTFNVPGASTEGGLGTIAQGINESGAISGTYFDQNTGDDGECDQWSGRDCRNLYRRLEQLSQFLSRPGNWLACTAFEIVVAGTEHCSDLA